MKWLFTEPGHQPFDGVPIVLGLLLLLVNTLPIPAWPVGGQAVMNLLGISMLLSGVAELLPRSWRAAAGLLRLGGLIGLGCCVIGLLVVLARTL